MGIELTVVNVGKTYLSARCSCGEGRTYEGENLRLLANLIAPRRIKEPKA